MQNIIFVISKIFTGRAERKNNNIPQDESLRLEHMQTHIITNIIIICGFLTTMFFATFFDRNDITSYIIQCVICAILLASFLMRRFWGGGSSTFYHIYGKVIPVSTLCLLFAMLYYRGNDSGFDGIWILLTPIISIFILGKRGGIITSVIMMIWILIVGCIKGNEWHFSYPIPSTIRYLGTYILIMLFTYIYEHIRSQHHKHILKMYNNLKKENSDLERLGLLDKLTEINNLHGFEILADRVWRLAINENKTLSFAMLDIDNFKDFNDSHGSNSGNTMLKIVAKTFGNCACRPLDTIVRIDEDKFGALFFDTDIKQAAWIAKKICADIGSVTPIDVSIGVASQTPNDNLKLKDLIAVADANLLKAKENGKNQIVAI